MFHGIQRLIERECALRDRCYNDPRISTAPACQVFNAIGVTADLMTAKMSLPIHEDRSFVGSDELNRYRPHTDTLSGNA